MRSRIITAELADALVLTPGPNSAKVRKQSYVPLLFEHIGQGTDARLANLLTFGERAMGLAV